MATKTKSKPATIRDGVYIRHPQNNRLLLPIPAPKNDDELWLSVKLILGIEIPRESVCTGHVAPFTAFADAYFARQSMAVWKGSRGLSGKTLLLATLGFMESIFLGSRGVILGGSLEQSKRVHEYQRLFWEYKNAPKYMLQSDPTATKTTLSNGATMVCLTASQKSARGEHPQRLRLDEVDEMDLDIFDAAMGQTMTSTLEHSGQQGIKTQTVACSTHQNTDGTMTEILRRAGERGWPVMEWCFKESMTGWLTQEMVDTKRNEVSSEMWRVEYELGEPSIGNRAMLTDKVDALFDPSLGEYEGAPSEYLEFAEPLSPESGARYIHGVDWAKEQDWTIIATFRADTHPRELVAYERMGRLPWPVMVKRLDERLRRYPGRALHDATGVGNVVKDMLTEKAQGVVLAGRSRDDMLTEYISAVERGDYIAPRIRHAYTEHKYATMDSIYGSGHLPDTVCAFALAHRAAHRPLRPFAIAGV